MSTHHHRAYGLHVVCNEPLPGLACGEPEDGTPGVVVHLGAFPTDVEDVPGGPERPWPADGGGDPRITTLHGGTHVRIRYDEGVEFLCARDGSRVWGRSESERPVEELAPHLLGPVLGFVLRLRGVTCLHASAVLVGEAAVAFAGGSGVGKSTAAAAMALAGHAVLADDILALEESPAGVMRAVLGTARVLLWPDAVALLEGSADARPRVSPVWEKRYLDLQAESFVHPPRAAPLAIVALLEPEGPVGGVAAIPLSPAEAVSRLAANAYGSAWLDDEMRARDLEFLARLAERVPVMRVRCHPGRTDPDRLATALLDFAETKGAG